MYSYTNHLDNVYSESVFHRIWGDDSCFPLTESNEYHGVFLKCPHLNSPVYPVSTSLTNRVPACHTKLKSVHGWLIVFGAIYPIGSPDFLLIRFLKNGINLPKLQTNHKLIEKYLFNKKGIFTHHGGLLNQQHGKHGSQECRP